MAETLTQWWRGGIVYEIYPRSFKDSNGDGIGDLRGITQHLAYVADLGVDAIWITPFFKSPMADFGYDVADYRQVDPIFGTLADFDALTKEAHRLGLKVLVDYVISHTSDEHPWFVESRSSRDNPKADWYVWADRKPDGGPPNNWLSVFGGPSWLWDTRRRQYFLHNFLTQQPDLNVHNPEVQAAILGEMEFWLKRGVDGFRLDALNFSMHDRQLRDNPPSEHPETSEQPLSNPYAYQKHLFDKSQPELPEFLKRIRALLDRYGANTTSLAEIGDDAELTLKLMNQYAGQSDKIHMSYGFDFLSTTFTPAHFATTIQRYQAGAADSWPCWAFSNHDCIRHASRWTRPGQSMVAVARLAAALLLSLRGSVCLYQGEELGLPEADIRFEDLQDPAGKTFWPEYKGRDGCRTPFPWDGAAENAGFGAGTPWLPVSPVHKTMGVAQQVGDPAGVLAFYKQAISVRKSTGALLLGELDVVQATEDLLVLQRHFGNETVVCAFNFGDVTLDLDIGTGTVLLASTGSSASTVGLLGYVWLRVE
ncbi:alpha-glucosidase [Devosia sp. YR412]|uniref:alpha-amylase family glycosyl hydrolase n=1 Tax=Devosia sp. YR412 TaxID=1881030 RepID=UPI0008CBF433|nr:alpha-amylase family glycosyl hydrolase [Devosia sp. YR412]SEP61735.1 alpha-glucosidase [Devosia sp. YR412]